MERTFSTDGKQEYSDNTEMSGKRVAAIVSYTIDSVSTLSLARRIFFAQLHPFIKENDPSWYVYRSYLNDIHTGAILSHLYIKSKSLGRLKKCGSIGCYNLNTIPLLWVLSYDENCYRA